MGRRVVGILAIFIGTVMLFNIVVDLGARAFIFGFQRDGLEQRAQTEPILERLTTTAEPNGQGAQVFVQECAACHGREGQGGFGPTLAGNDELGDAAFVIGRILGGGGGMPAFDGLSDEEVAAIGTYIRSSWGNDFGPVSAEEVASQR